MMCLAIPALVKKIDGSFADIEVQGTSTRISIALVPEVKVGDYVLVHAGYALQVLDKEDAEETLKLWEEIYGDN